MRESSARIATRPCLRSARRRTRWPPPRAMPLPRQQLADRRRARRAAPRRCCPARNAAASSARSPRPIRPRVTRARSPVSGEDDDAPLEQADDAAGSPSAAVSRRARARGTAPSRIAAPRASRANRAGTAARTPARRRSRSAHERAHAEDRDRRATARAVAVTQSGRSDVADRHGQPGERRAQRERLPHRFRIDVRLADDDRHDLDAARRLERRHARFDRLGLRRRRGTWSRTTTRFRSAASCTRRPATGCDNTANTRRSPAVRTAGARRSSRSSVSSFSSRYPIARASSSSVSTRRSAERPCRARPARTYRRFTSPIGTPSRIGGERPQRDAADGGVRRPGEQQPPARRRIGAGQRGQFLARSPGSTGRRRATPRIPRTARAPARHQPPTTACRIETGVNSRARTR